MSASRAKFINDYLHRFSNKIEINNFSINDYDEMPSDVGINANHEISDDVSTNESNNISDNIIFNKDANQSVIEDKDLIAMSIAKQEEVVDLIITSKVDEKNEENFPINSDKGEDIECDEKIIENKNSDKNEDCAVSNIISDDYSISDLSIDIIQLGKKIKNDLYHKYGDDLYNAWFSNLYLIKINNNNTAVFSILTLFIKEWIISHYVDDLESIIKVHIDYISGVEIVVNADLVVENNENC
ncbi:MAG: hypothetical protein OEY79_03500, partial [Anaplasmataceae bacterium]|nr:hypothetical protein [Anaplasmataceae bacterium]